MKITYGMLLSRATDKPFLLVVKWTNETLICNVGQVNWQVKMGGRVKNKRDDADIEPMMYCGIEESFVTPDAFFKGGSG